ncbi:MAG: transposase [Bryobacterales bacterium]|nr:transposase [Bryobacterales bacterium]
MKQIFGRADSGFYCREAVQAYEAGNARFVITACRTKPLMERVRKAEWKESRQTDAEWECEFRYHPDDWKTDYRFVAPRYEKTREEAVAEEPEQYQLFESSQYQYRALVTDMTEPIDVVFWFYNQRGGADNLVKEANNDAGLAAHPSHRFDVNSNHFQLADAGLQPELLANAVQPRAARGCHGAATHDAGDLTAALPVRGSQGLASRRTHRRKL